MTTKPLPNLNDALAEANGLARVMTGGGCEAYCGRLDGQHYILVTSTDGGDVPQAPDAPVLVGTYSYGDGCAVGGVVRFFSLFDYLEKRRVENELAHALAVVVGGEMPWCIFWAEPGLFPDFSERTQFADGENLALFCLRAKKYHGGTIMFRLYDGDENLYFKGKIWRDHIEGDDAYKENSFAPLDWARTYAGCTTMKYLSSKTGTWEVL